MTPAMPHIALWSHWRGRPVPEPFKPREALTSRGNPAFFVLIDDRYGGPVIRNIANSGMSVAIPTVHPKDETVNSLGTPNRKSI
jgi:hypothetical protein